MHRLLQFFSPLPDALFEQFLMLANLRLRCRQRLNHPVEAFAQVFDLVAGTADLDMLEAPLAHRRDAGLEQRQRPREKPSGKLGNGRGHHHYDSAQDHSLGPVKGVLLDVPPQNRGNHPQHQEAREDGELRRQRAELVRMLLVHDISMFRRFGLRPLSEGHLSAVMFSV